MRRATGADARLSLGMAARGAAALHVAYMSTAPMLLSDSLEQQACEVAVQALVPADELVAEGEARHEAALLEPEDGAEAAGGQGEDGDECKVMLAGWNDGMAWAGMCVL